MFFFKFALNMESIFAEINVSFSNVIKSEELEESKVCRVSGNIFGFGLVIFSSLLFSSLFSFYNFSVIIHLNHHGDSRKFLKIKINKTREKQNSLNSSLKTLSKEPCFP